MKKSKAFKNYMLMWRNIFNYRDIASKREYWFPVLINAVIAILGAIFTSLATFLESKPCLVLAWVFDVYFALTIIPFVSLTVRRLHDTGRSGWWTCLLLAVGVGTLWVLLMCASTAYPYFNPIDNDPEDVYGPPEWWYEEYDPRQNEEAGVYDSPDFDDKFDPIKNEEATVYGPPEWFEDNGDDYDPSIEVPEDVYGPPAWDGVDEDEE